MRGTTRDTSDFPWYMCFLRHSLKVVGRSAVGQYIDLLLNGCRCVELDCWNGSDGEPVLFHGVGGYQLTGRIKFRHVIQACRDYGFQVSA